LMLNYNWCTVCWNNSVIIQFHPQ